MKYILGYVPFEDEFSNCVQGVSWQTKSGGYLLSVREWFEKGARINVARFDASEGGTTKRVIAGTDTPWVYQYGKQLTTIATFLGDRFYSESSLKEAIKEKINDPNLFN